MALNISSPKVKFPKPAIVTWDTWKDGLNIFARETEIGPREMSSATNIILQGVGIPSKRWGSQDSFIAAPSSSYMGRLVQAAKDRNDNIQVLALTDWGYLVKQSNASYTQLTGASFLSGYNVSSVQLAGNVYLVSQAQPMVKYDFNNLFAFNALAAPTALTATNISGATGTQTYSWIVTATSGTGETLGSTAVSLASLPQNLTTTTALINWTATSAASGDLTGYNVYRGTRGNERFVGGVPSGVTQFFDNGGSNANGNFTPVADTTSGISGKYIIRFQDRLIIAGVPGYPYRVYVSGRYLGPNSKNQERFDAYAGGTFCDVEPDSGEDITGLGIYYRTQSSTQTIVAFKERSVWEITLDIVTAGNTAIPSFPLTVPSYRLLTGSQGCISHRTIAAVENDVMFLNRRGIYILRYEPNLFNIINANEISVKVRPFFEGLSSTDLQMSSALYTNSQKRYIVSFPNTNQSMCFDRERLAFTGPWKTPFGVNKWTSYFDSTSTEHWLSIASTDNKVREFATTLTDDSGTAIATSFKTRKEVFGDWTLFKNLSEVYMNFRNLQGATQVNIYIEDRTGVVSTAKSFTIIGTTGAGSSGIGTDEMGLFEMGESSNSSSTVAGETQKVAIIYKTTRSMQVEILTTNSTDYYELLNIKGVATIQARGNFPSIWRV